MGKTMSEWKKRMTQILDDVLETDYIKEKRKERDVKDEIDFYGYVRRKTDFELELLYNFFEENIEEILKVESIWILIQENVRDEIEWKISTRENFLKEGIYFNMEQYVENGIYSLQCNLQGLYRERLNAEWKGLTPKQARKKLPKNQQYIALLNKNGKLTKEPHPITRNMKANLTWEIRIDKHERPIGVTVKKRNIHVKSDKPLKQGETYTSMVIALEDSEVNAEIIKT